MRWARRWWGDTRTKTRFLFLPKTIIGETRWLEIARWEEQYTSGYAGHGWGAVKWLDR